MQVDELDPQEQAEGTSELEPSELQQAEAAVEETSDQSPPEAQAAAPDVDIEELLKRPEIQQIIERRAANLAGNRLQEQVQQERQWKAAEEYYQRLAEDDDFYEEEIRKHGKARVLRFLADFEAAKEAREKQPQVEPMLIQMAEQFNTAAIGAFKTYVKQSPLWHIMPQETRQRLESIAYDPETPWIEEALKLLVDAAAKGGQPRLARQAEQTRQAFQRTAGGPLPAPAANRASVDPRKIIEDYAYGRGNWTIDDYDWARQQLRQDW
jgi:hypothetical protein